MATMTRTDATIRQAILDELDWDPEVEGARIGVEVSDGSVRLTGATRAYQRYAAERAARRVPGVRSVENHLSIRDPLVPDDAQVAKMATLALATDPAIPHERIGVGVHDGIVELTVKGSNSLGDHVTGTVTLVLPGAPA